MGAIAITAFTFYLTARDQGSVVLDHGSDAGLNFAEVVRADLIEVTEFDGTLGQIEEIPVVVRRSGVVTAVVEPGTVIQAGDPIIWIDNQPVMLLYGETPAWRRMSVKTAGPDVRQLEIALTALGFNPDESEFTVDDAYTTATREAVKAWQDSIGVEIDGIVDYGEILFSSGPIVVDSVLVSVGEDAKAGTAVLSTSANDLKASFSLPAIDKDRVPVGTEVTVKLPDLRTVQGVVSEISTVASSSQSFGSVFAATVELVDPTEVSDVGEVPVTIQVVTDSREQVLVVPVQALLALLEGGYAVEVKTATGVSVVPVEIGFYASGKIEIQGSLTPGDQVVIP